MNKKSKSHIVPVSWPEAKTDFREMAEYGVSILTKRVTDILAVKPSVTIAPKFAAFPALLMRVAVMLGPDSCVTAIQQMDALFVRARDEFSKGITKHNRISVTGILNYVNVARCCGATVDFSDQTMVEWLGELLPHQEAFTEFECETLALASLACHQPNWVLSYLNGEAERDFTPGRVFGPNVYGMILYLLVAEQHKAVTSDVEPAWNDFLLAFPRKLEAKTLEWPDLAWAARVYYCDFLGVDTPKVLTRLHEQVQELIQ